MNDETQPADQPVAPQPVSPQRRLQQLQAIPERQRTDAEWDELNELEISLTPANRDRPTEPGARGQGAAPAANRPRPAGSRSNDSRPAGPRPTGPRPGGPRPAGERGPKPVGEQVKKPFRKFNKRPPKNNNTP